MRRFLVLGVVCSLLAAACGGGDGEATSTTGSTAAPVAASPTTDTSAAPTTMAAVGVTAASDDGRVTLDAPPEALATDPGITITALAASDQPEDLAAFDAPMWVYALEPGALQFDDPVRMTVEIPFAEVAQEEAGDGTPVVVLITTAKDGEGWELLADQVIRRDGDVVTVSGTTDHFSRLAAVHEQVFIEARFLDVSQDATATIGIDWLGPGGALLDPPGMGATSFLPEGTDAVPLGAAAQGDGMQVHCPPGVSGVSGDLSIEALLPKADGASQGVGLAVTPYVTFDETVRLTVEVGLHLVCRPTIAGEGSVQLEAAVDHPGGEVIIPNEDFGDGLSGLLLSLAREFPGLFVGLIGDVDNDGRIGPEDLMYPPVAATVGGGTTTAVLPLYGYGDYFPYFVDGLVLTELQTAVAVPDGATVLLGGLMAEQTSVPMLGDLPFIVRVFGEESRQSEDVELLVLLTPRILETDGE